jgi:hypothetical protein
MFKCWAVTLPPLNKCNCGSPQNQPGTVQLPYKKPLQLDPLLHLFRGGRVSECRLLLLSILVIVPSSNRLTSMLILRDTASRSMRPHSRGGSGASARYTKFRCINMPFIVPRKPRASSHGPFGTEEKRGTSPYFCLSSVVGYLHPEKKERIFRERPWQVSAAFKGYPTLFTNRC